MSASTVPLAELWNAQPEVKESVKPLRSATRHRRTRWVWQAGKPTRVTLSLIEFVSPILVVWMVLGYISTHSLLSLVCIASTWFCWSMVHVTRYLMRSNDPTVVKEWQEV